MIEEEILPFESFSSIYTVLIWSGYTRLRNKPKNRLKWICHQLYRPFAFLLVVWFNIQHFIFIYQKRDSMDDVFDSLMIEVPQLNLAMKYLNLNLQTKRIDNINKLINDPIFGGNNQKDKNVIIKNNMNVNRMYKIINYTLSVSVFTWFLSLFAKRYQNENAVVPVYIPFDTRSWGKYTLSVFMVVGLAPWVAFGHFALDCLVCAHYAQVQVQLNIIKHNLICLFDADGRKGEYKDNIDLGLKQRFMYYVQRFEKIAWYTKEINDVFSPAILFQFFTSSATICLVIFKMSITPVTSFDFLHMVFFFSLLSTQVFIYCYSGNMVKSESQTIVDSLYLSDWLAVSPKFRGLLLISMLRWSQSLTPTVSGIIPLSLNTFISILRGAYSLYTVLGTKKS